jgi:hypothetical protein
MKISTLLKSILIAMAIIFLIVGLLEGVVIIFSSWDHLKSLAHSANEIGWGEVIEFYLKLLLVWITFSISKYSISYDRKYKTTKATNREKTIKYIFTSGTVIIVALVFNLLGDEAGKETKIDYAYQFSLLTYILPPALFGIYSAYKEEDKRFDEENENKSQIK